MKQIFQAGKRALIPLLLCLALLTGQAACDLRLPGLLDRLAVVGFRQRGMEQVLPQAMNSRGMELLEYFMTDEEKQTLKGLYNLIEPESSEAGRLSGAYPLAREIEFFSLREGLPGEELRRGREIYGKAALAFQSYVKAGKESGELNEERLQLAREHAQAQSRAENRDPGEFGDNVRLPAQEESSLPEGVLGSVPEGALYQLPESPSSSEAPESAYTETVVKSSRAKTFGQGESSSQPEETPSPVISLPEDFSQAFPGDVYELLLVLDQASAESLAEAASSASSAPSSGRDRAGASLQVLFYRELGVDTAKRQSEFLWGALLRFLGVGLLGLLAGLLASAASFRAASQLEKGSGQRTLLIVGVRGLWYGPILTVGGLILAVRLGGWTAAVIPLLLGAGLGAGAVLLPRFRPVPGLRRLFRTVSPFLASAVLAPVSLILLLAAWLSQGEGLTPVLCGAEILSGLGLTALVPSALQNRKSQKTGSSEESL